MSNSIIAATSPKAKAVEISMTLKNPIYQHRLLVLVEGADDILLYQKFLNEDTTKIEAVGTCNYFKEVLDYNSAKSDRFIVIKDSDFENIIGFFYTYPNLFRTDTHDAETLMMTENFKQNFKCEFLLNKAEYLNHVERVKEELRPLSYIKLHNVENRLRLKFVKCCKYYNGTPQLTLTDCINTIDEIPINKLNHNHNEEDIIATISKYPEIDLMQLTNGHDLCEGIIYKCKTFNIEINKDAIPHHLRMLYSLEDFKKTKLYSDIMLWASKHKYKIFKV